MATFDRTTILKGPCKIAYDSADFFSRGDVTVTFSRTLFEKTSSAFGRHGEGVEDKFITIQFAPIMYDAAQIAKLWPYAALAPGMSLLGSTDKTLVITPRNGDPLTIKNAFVDVPPTLTLSANQPLIGDVTFMGLIAKDGDPSSAAAYFEYGGSPANDADLAGFDGSKDINAVYSLTRNSITYFAEAGFVLNPNLEANEDRVDGFGLVGKSLTRMEPSVTFQPAGMTEAAIAALQDFATSIGKEDTKYDLTIQGQADGDILFTLPSTIIGPQNDRRYGAEVKRVGEIEFRSQRGHTSGDLDAAWTFAAVSST